MTEATSYTSRARAVREAIARETAKRPRVDANGYPIDPNSDTEPVLWTSDPNTGMPVRIRHHSTIDPDTGRRTWYQPEPPEAA